MKKQISITWNILGCISGLIIVSYTQEDYIQVEKSRIRESGSLFKRDKVQH